MLIIKSRWQEGVRWKCHWHIIYVWNVIKVIIKQPINKWPNDHCYGRSWFRFLLHQWLRCKSSWASNTCQDTYINQCLIKLFFFLCCIVGYSSQLSFDFSWPCQSIQFCEALHYFFCRVEGVLPIEATITFVAWKGLYFAKLCGFFLLRWMHHGDMLISLPLSFSIIVVAYFFHIHYIFFFVFSSFVNMFFCCLPLCIVINLLSIGFFSMRFWIFTWLVDFLFSCSMWLMAMVSSNHLYTSQNKLWNLLLHH